MRPIRGVCRPPHASRAEHVIVVPAQISRKLRAAGGTVAAHGTSGVCPTLEGWTSRRGARTATRPTAGVPLRSSRVAANPRPCCLEMRLPASTACCSSRPPGAGRAELAAAACPASGREYEEEASSARKRSLKDMGIAQRSGGARIRSPHHSCSAIAMVVAGSAHGRADSLAPAGSCSRRATRVQTQRARILREASDGLIMFRARRQGVPACFQTRSAMNHALRASRRSPVAMPFARSPIEKYRSSIYGPLLAHRHARRGAAIDAGADDTTTAETSPTLRLPCAPPGTAAAAPRPHPARWLRPRSAHSAGWPDLHAFMHRNEALCAVWRGYTGCARRGTIAISPTLRPSRRSSGRAISLRNSTGASRMRDR